MRLTVVVLFVAAKLVALGLLPILVLGYLFFLGSQSLLGHLYVAATVLGLVFTVATTARTFRSIRIVYGAAVLAALALGCWRIHQHLTFFEGPEYGAATMTGMAVMAMVVGFVGSHHLSGLTRNSADV